MNIDYLQLNKGRFPEQSGTGYSNPIRVTIHNTRNESILVLAAKRGDMFVAGFLVHSQDGADFIQNLSSEFGTFLSLDDGILYTLCFIKSHSNALSTNALKALEVAIDKYQERSLF